MSEPLKICLIALTVNLAGMLLIYSVMASALVRLRWRHRGLIAVVLTIIIAGIFWIGPTILAFGQDPKTGGALSYSLWLGNWLVSAFSVVILGQTARTIPRQLLDSARLDGCGWFGIYWHVLRPLLWRELGLIAFLTLMATSALCWSAVAIPGSQSFVPLWMAPDPAGPTNPATFLFLGEMLGGALVATLPVILIFFFSKRYLEEPSIRQREATAMSPRTG